MSSPKIRFLICAIFMILALTIPKTEGDDKGKGKGPPKLPSFGSQSCKAQKTAHVNESWLLSIKKWYIVFADELSQSSLTSAAALPDVKSIQPRRKKKPSKKVCWTTSTKFGKEGDKKTPPPLPFSYSCKYDDDIAKQSCHLKELDQIPEELAALIGLLPSSMDLVFVMTDNESYIAVVTCLSGVFRQFVVLSIDPKGPDEATMKEIKKKFGPMGLGSAKDQLKNINKADKSKKLSPGGLAKEIIQVTNCKGPHGPGERSGFEEGAMALKKMDKIGLSKLAAGSRSASDADPPPV